MMSDIFCTATAHTTWLSISAYIVHTFVHSRLRRTCVKMHKVSTSVKIQKSQRTIQLLRLSILYSLSLYVANELFRMCITIRF